SWSRNASTVLSMNVSMSTPIDSASSSVATSIRGLTQRAHRRWFWYPINDNRRAARAPFTQHCDPLERENFWPKSHILWRRHLDRWVRHLRRLRQAKKLSQVEAGAASGPHACTLTKIEAGEVARVARGKSADTTIVQHPRRTAVERVCPSG